MAAFDHFIRPASTSGRSAEPGGSDTGAGVAGPGRRRRRACATGLSVLVLAAAGVTGLALAHKVAPPAGRTSGRPGPGGEHDVGTASRHSAGTASRHHAGTASTHPAGTGPWTSGTLTITPRSLGGVTVGMTLARASAAAGEQLVHVGDGFAYPNGNAASGLSVSGNPVQCFAVVLGAAGPDVLTIQGFALGGTLAQLKTVYGASLTFVPAPATGYSPKPGYVVSFQSGNLAFVVRSGIVDAIIGGPNVQPSSPC